MGCRFSHTSHDSGSKPTSSPCADDPTPLSIAERPYGQTLVLFDVDGTLSMPTQKAPDAVLTMLANLRRECVVGIVGTGKFSHQSEQIPDLHLRVDFVFSENGAHAFHQGRELHCHSIECHLGPVLWQNFHDGLLRMLDDERDERARLLELVGLGGASALSDRGTFLDVRNGVVNICPIGRSPTLSKDERDAFETSDRASGLRERLVRRIQEEFGPETDFQITASIGGQIGIDCCPRGWEKTYCLQFVPEADFPIVHFFGDKTMPGGNDYEIFTHSRVIGHTVMGYEDTLRQVEAKFLRREPLESNLAVTA